VTRDVRICFVGDSLVAGLGDRQCLGWAGRLAVRAIGAGQPLSYYNLGVRRQTSADIAARWEQECAERLPGGVDARVVFCFGVNDTMVEDGRPRVEPERSADHLAGILHRARARGWPVLVVAPPPNADAAHTSRIGELTDLFAAVCERESAPFVRVFDPLRDSTTWMREVTAGDGYHPSGTGYDEFAALIVPHWLLWLAEPGTVLPVVR
jgi:acyl-CoA thioesterase I